MNDLAVSDVDADVSGFPDGKAGDFGDGVDRALFACVGVHRVRADVRHSVCRIADLARLGVKPAVALDQPHTVRRSAKQPVFPNEIFQTRQLVRVLLQLGIQQVFGQNLPIGAPDIAPARFLRRNRPLHEIEIVFARRVDVAGGVDVDGTDGIHELRKIVGR